MMIKSSRLSILRTLALIGLTLAVLWYFFATRISTAAMYFFIGLHAPSAIRIDCARQTERLVSDKFKLPLAFDRASKDGLRGFWHYSFYTNCLFNHGYDHSGNSLPPSKMVSDYDYSNTQGKFVLEMSGATTILSDNQVDAAYDDRLRLSTLSRIGKVVTVGWYKKYDPMTLEEFKTAWTHFPHTDEALMIASDSGILTATNSAGLTGCMRFFDAKPILLYGDGLSRESCQLILRTLRSQHFRIGT